MSIDSILIPTVSSPIRGAIRPPSSKSITNRALICAALAQGTSILVQPLASDDTEVMLDSLERLGIDLQLGHANSLDEAAHSLDEDRRPPDHGVRSRVDSVRIQGCGGVLPREHAELYIGNSGTTVRFLTAMLAAAGVGTYRLDGVPRMRERPIQDLLDALNALGGDTASELGTGCPPVVVRARGLRGGEVRVRGDISSQYLSGLLMAVPYAKSPTRIRIEGELVSRPYVRMTLDLMKTFGVTARVDGDDFVVDRPIKYVGRVYQIEPDASAASYFWGAAAITGGEVTVLDLNRDSLQGDIAFCDRLVDMGCSLDVTSNGMTLRGPQVPKKLHGIDCNMNAISDTVQTLAAVALFADGPTTVRGVAHNRHKETDRIGNLAIELRKFGAQVDELDDGLRIHPPAVLKPARIATYDDHRMAMSLSLPGLRVAGVEIENPACTAKTYPDFFRDLIRICAA